MLCKMYLCNYLPIYQAKWNCMMIKIFYFQGISAKQSTSKIAACLILYVYLLLHYRQDMTNYLNHCNTEYSVVAITALYNYHGLVQTMYTKDLRVYLSITMVCLELSIIYCSCHSMYTKHIILYLHILNVSWFTVRFFCLFYL